MTDIRDQEGRGTKLNEQLFAYVRSAGFPCSETGTVRLEGRRIGVRVYARYNEEECVLVQGRHRRVFTRRRARGGVGVVGDSSARLQLLTALFLEEQHAIEQRKECEILRDPPASEGDNFRDRVRIGVRALLEQKGIEPDKIDELQEAIVDVVEKARLGAKVKP